MNNRENIVEYIGSKSYKEAIEGIDKVFITDSNRAYYFYLKGYCFSRLGNHTKTISLCKQALAGGIEDEECYLLIGESYEYMNWFKDAESNFLLGLEINPDNSEIKAAYGYLLLKNGYVSEAYNYIIQAITAAPENHIVNNYVVYFYLYKQSIMFAEYNIIKAFVENSSNEIYEFIKSGKVHKRKQRYKAAMDNFEKAYFLDPENEALAAIIDELKLKSKAIYKPLLLIEILGGWNGWIRVLASLAFVTVGMIFLQENRLLNLICSLTFFLWVLMGAYKFIVDSLYWKMYSWE